MPELIAKEPTEVEKLEKQVVVLETQIQQTKTELKKVQARKRPSIGYFRARFKGG